MKSKYDELILIITVTCDINFSNLYLISSFKKNVNVVMRILEEQFAPDRRLYKISSHDLQNNYFPTFGKILQQIVCV